MHTAQPESTTRLPALPPRYIQRARLIAALDAAAHAPLTLLSAGAGTGKTVLLAAWALSQDTPVGWISLTQADAEPRRFWRKLTAELHACSTSPVEPSGVPSQPPSAACVDSLLNELEHTTTPTVVVVDDAHLLTSPAVIDVLDRIICLRPPRLRLILAARSDPLLPLHRYRLEGRLAEMRANDLAMSEHEIRELLGAHGIVLDQRVMDTLVARTEGWTAGVRLSAIRMEGAENPGDFVTDLAMDQGSVGEYLMDEVLKRQPKPVRKLLVRTSFLSEVTGPLADAATGMEGCADLLAELARTNSFVIPLDAAQTRFRYHQLFADMLRYLLRREPGRTAYVTYARAAAWYDANHNPRAALRWALRAGDAPLIAGILSRGILSRAFVHRYDLSASGLRDALPILTSNGVNPAHIAVSRAVIAAADPGQRAAYDVTSASIALPQETTTDVDLHVTADVAKLVVGQRVGDAALVHSAAGRLLSRDFRQCSSLGGSLAAAVLLADANMHIWNGEFTDVEDKLGAALAIAETIGLRNLELEILGTISLLDTYWCRPNRADNAAHRAREILHEHDRMEPPAALELAAALRSLIAADFTGLGQALQRTLIVDGVGSDPGVVGVLTLARGSLLMECGEFHAARALLHASRECAPRTLLATRRDMLLADSDTAQGRPRAALTLMQRYRRTRFDELVAVVRARAYLRLGDLGRAEQCARAVLTGASPQVSRYQTIEAMLCDAEVALRRDDTARALEVLVAALEIADRVVVLPFAQANNTFAELLDRHPEVAAEWPVPPLAPLRGQPQSLLNPVPTLVDPLTERERTVVRFLATSMSTAEIAGELCISVNTVKTHLAAIYRKLAARKRREAVVRARELELL